MAVMAAIILLTGALCAEVIVGARRPEVYVPMLEGKRVALLSNHTGIVDNSTHIADLMLEQGVDLCLLLSPEHGFRGNADAGEHVASGRDAVTGLDVVSMYDGRRRGLTKETLDRFDVAVIDLQDVGVRFYTYYITMLDLMRDCAAAGKGVVVLDRPNPLCMEPDGPVLDMTLASGVGRLPVPVVHGMTMGEIALFANGENLVGGGRRVDDLRVVPCLGYTHSTPYDLPVAPSPNLKSMQAIVLYPSLCLFEGTPVSVGRGTDVPFTLYGHPSMRKAHPGFSFEPQSRPGAKNPPCLGKRCYGVDLSGLPRDTIVARGFDLDYLIDAYRSMESPEKFFTPFFDRLAGTRELRRQIAAGMSAEAIRNGWRDAVDAFKKRRAPYMLYD